MSDMWFYEYELRQKEFLRKQQELEQRIRNNTGNSVGSMGLFSPISGGPNSNPPDWSFMVPSKELQRLYDEKLYGKGVGSPFVKGDDSFWKQFEARPNTSVNFGPASRDDFNSWELANDPIGRKQRADQARKQAEDRARAGDAFNKQQQANQQELNDIFDKFERDQANRRNSSPIPDGISREELDRALDRKIANMDRNKEQTRRGNEASGDYFNKDGLTPDAFSRERDKRVNEYGPQKENDLDAWLKRNGYTNRPDQLIFRPEYVPKTGESTVQRLERERQASRDLDAGIKRGEWASTGNGVVKLTKQQQDAINYRNAEREVLARREAQRKELEAKRNGFNPDLNNQDRKALEAARNRQKQDDSFKISDFSSGRSRDSSGKISGNAEDGLGRIPQTRSGKSSIVPTRSKFNRPEPRPLDTNDYGDSGGSGRRDNPKRPYNPDGGFFGNDGEWLYDRALRDRLAKGMGTGTIPNYPLGGGPKAKYDGGIVNPRLNTGNPNGSPIIPQYSRPLNIPMNRGMGTPMGRTANAAGGVGSLIDEAVKWGNALKEGARRDKSLEAARKMGFTDKEINDIANRARPDFVNGRERKFDSRADWDFAGDILEALKNKDNLEAWKKRKFGPQNEKDARDWRNNPDSGKNTPDWFYRPNKYNDKQQEELNRRARDFEREGSKLGKNAKDLYERFKDIAGKIKFPGNSDDYWGSPEQKRNKKRWDDFNKDPFKTDQRKQEIDPDAPEWFPGDPLPFNPPKNVLGWEVVSLHFGGYPDDVGNENIPPTYAFTTYIINSYTENKFDSGVPIMSRPSVSAYEIIHTYGYVSRSFTYADIARTRPIGARYDVEIPPEWMLEEKWGERWNWAYGDVRWWQYNQREENQWITDKFYTLDKRGRHYLGPQWKSPIILQATPISGDRDQPEPEKPPIPDPFDKDNKPMACAYREDLEVPTQLAKFDDKTGLTTSITQSIHKGTDEAFTHLSVEIAKLRKELNDVVKALEVDKYRQPAGKVIAPKLEIEAAQLLLTTTPALTVPLVKTLQGEMRVFGALNHALSGHHLLGKIRIPTDPNAGKDALGNQAFTTPLTGLGMIHKIYNNLSGQIGIPSDQSVVNSEGVTTKQNFKNQTDAIENVNGRVVSIETDVSSLQEMLFKVLQNQEMLINMVYKETYKTTALLQDTGARTTEEKVARPTVMTHAKKTTGTGTGTPSEFSWDKTFKGSEAYTSAVMWKGDLDKQQLGLKTNIEAQKAAASVYSPLSTKVPSLKTNKPDETQWKRYVKTINSGEEGKLYHGFNMPESLIEEIKDGVVKPIITDSVPFIDGRMTQ